MIDMHLINMALTSIYLAAGAAVLVAAMIIAVAATLHRPGSRQSHPAAASAPKAAPRREPALR